MKKIVGVAMSGGVDSSYTAAYFLQNGYEVFGVTMKLFANQAAHVDAKIVADFLNIKHYVLDLQDKFKDKVINNFCEEYSNAKTPNPCVRCNENIKFGALMDFVLEQGADYFATGHYARIDNAQLKKATNLNKDQSYFLYRIPRDKLSKIIFPLWNFSKNEVRSRAAEMNLPVATKKDSQEICFVPNDDYKTFLQDKITFKPGKIISTDGKILSDHSGTVNYTIGQRKGLGIANPTPLYVLKLNAENNSVIVGDNAELFKKNLTATDLKFLVDVPNEFRAKVKTRSGKRESPATVKIENGFAYVEFDEPQRAITPGQSVVFYDDDLVLGGGFIKE